jgi:hypothetical protein
MAGVAVGISLEIILMLGFGLPEVACRNEFCNGICRNFSEETREAMP